MELVKTTLAQKLFEQYSDILEVVALCDSQARLVELAGTFDENRLKVIMGYHLEIIDALKWELGNNWLNSPQGQLLLLRWETKYLFLIAYPSCRQKQLKEVVDSLVSKNQFLGRPSLSPSDCAFVQKCERQSIQYVGPLAFLLIKQAKKNYDFDRCEKFNRIVFLEHVTKLVESHTKSPSQAQSFFAEIISSDSIDSIDSIYLM